MDEIIFSFINQFNTFILLAVLAMILWILGKSADLAVDQAITLSYIWKVPKLIVGATIVSLGTTLPEVTVSVIAAINGEPGTALGNAVGSVITDTGLILGLAVLLGVVPITGKAIKVQGRIQLFAGYLLVFVALPFSGLSIGGKISQLSGILFLVLLVIYILFSVKCLKEDDLILQDEFEQNENLIYILFKFFIGVCFVILASKFLIPTIKVLAIRVNIPKSIISATLVAFGTSLPELVTSISAVKKGQGQLAIGNVIGADILNVFFVVGMSATVTSSGLNVPISFYKVQFPAMIIILSVFRLCVKTSEKTLSKLHGVLLLGLYIIYLVLSFVFK
ncbi:MAG: sodium:calcium antiporter [Clostridiales bacterium]|nr:MAG: sodium:calcium antiporter [Clostridiales bacterium]